MSLLLLTFGAGLLATDGLMGVTPHLEAPPPRTARDIGNRPIPLPVPSPEAERFAATVSMPGESPIAWISIPALELVDIPIYGRGLSANRNMLIAPGFAVTHYSYSAQLGGSSNAVLYAHDDIEGSVFGRLADLRGGDGITIRLGSGGIVRYTVAGAPAVVAPGDVGILRATPSAELTLFSCYPVDVDSQRVVVTARPVT